MERVSKPWQESGMMVTAPQRSCVVWSLQVLHFRSQNLPYWSKGMKVKKISGWVTEWHEIDSVEGICHFPWNSGHCSKKHKKPTNTEHPQEEGGESIFPWAIKKNGGTDISAILVKPELQKIKSDPQDDQPVTQGHSAADLQVFLPGREPFSSRSYQFLCVCTA